MNALCKCLSLHTLNLVGTGVTNVSALGNLANLHKLDLSFTGVTDISALKDCPNLHTLNLTGCNFVTDINVNLLKTRNPKLIYVVNNYFFSNPYFLSWR